MLLPHTIACKIRYRLGFRLSARSVTGAKNGAEAPKLEWDGAEWGRQHFEKTLEGERNVAGFIEFGSNAERGFLPLTVRSYALIKSCVAFMYLFIFFLFPEHIDQDLVAIFHLPCFLALSSGVLQCTSWFCIIQQTFHPVALFACHFFSSFLLQPAVW